MSRYARYDEATKKEIKGLILNEWTTLGRPKPTGRIFVSHMLKLFHERGITTPTGDGIHYGCVASQIYSILGKKVWRVNPKAKKSSPVKQQPQENKVSLLSRKSKKLVMTILNNDDLSPLQKVLMVNAYFGVD